VGATLTRPLRREDGRLDPSLPSADLERRVRAYLPWPGTFLEADGERLVVVAASVGPSAPGDVPGRLVRHGDRPAFTTADGRLVLEAVTPPGRRPMSGADWLRGRRTPLPG
jgi:methionyl-tRNA formyltransferase